MTESKIRIVQLNLERGLFIPESILVPTELIVDMSKIESYVPATVLIPTPAPAPNLSGFKFSAKSESELVGVHPPLVKVVRRALQLSTQDFMVYDGLRTVEEQRKHVANGTSQTMKSKHLDGLAVDLVPYINGKLVWDWEGCYRIAMAMDEAATEQGVANKIRWGGAWDRVLSDFGGDVAAYKRETRLYASRHPGKDFLDGPHFEWVV